ADAPRAAASVLIRAGAPESPRPRSTPSDRRCSLGFRQRVVPAAAERAVEVDEAQEDRSAALGEFVLELEAPPLGVEHRVEVAETLCVERLGLLLRLRGEGGSVRECGGAALLARVAAERVLDLLERAQDDAVERRARRVAQCLG